MACNKTDPAHRPNWTNKAVTVPRSSDGPDDGEQPLQWKKRGMSNTSTSPSQNSRSAWSGGESALTEKRDLKQGVVKQFSNGRVLGVVRVEEFMACSRCLSPCGRSVPGKARTLHGRPGPPGLVLQVLFCLPSCPVRRSCRTWLGQCKRLVELLLYVHRKRRFIKDESPGRPPPP